MESEDSNDSGSDFGEEESSDMPSDEDLSEEGLSWDELDKQAEEEVCAVGIFLQQFVTIQVKAVGHYGDLLAKYKVAEYTKELLEFDQHIN